MYRFLYVIFFCFCIIDVSAQDVYDSDYFLEKASEELSREAYQEAQKYLEKIDILDPNYFESFENKLLVSQGLEDYEGIEKELDSLHALGEFAKYPQLYTIRGQVYANKEEYKKAIHIYTEGEALFPLYDDLFFFKSIALYGDGDKQGAIDYIKKTIEINPHYQLAHYLLATYALENGRLSEGVLAMLGFLSIDPENEYAQNAVQALNVKFTQNYLDRGEVTFSDSGDQFDNLELILRNQLPLDPNYKLRVDIDEFYTRYAQAVIDYAQDHEIKDGYFETNYMPFLKDIGDKGLSSDFIYYSIFSFEETLGKKLKRKKKKIVAFYEDYILGDFWPLFGSRTRMIEGKPMKAMVSIENGSPSIVGPFVNGKKEGFHYYYDKYGRVIAQLNYIQDKADGWLSFLDPVTGKVNEKMYYKEDEKDGEHYTYYPSGVVETKTLWSGGKKEGQSLSYFWNGQVQCTVNYKDDVAQGELECYYITGQLKSKVMYKDGVMEGEKLLYYSNGDPQESGYLSDNLYKGKVTYYGKGSYANAIVDYDKGNVIGDYKSYSLDSTLLKDVKVSDKEITELLYVNNQAIEKFVYDREMNLKNYTLLYDGQPYYTEEHDNKKVKNASLYVDGVKKKVKLDKVDVYHPLGYLSFTKTFDKNQLTSYTSYYVNGTKAEAFLYQDNMMEGVQKEWDKRGRLKNVYHYQKDTLHGAVMSYEDGHLVAQSNYYKGSIYGPSTFYYKPTGEVQSKQFFYGDEIYGTTVQYDRDGNITHTSKYYQGSPVSDTYYRSDDSIAFVSNYQNQGHNGSLDFFRNPNKTEILKRTFQNGIDNGYTEIVEKDGNRRADYYMRGDVSYNDVYYYYPNGVKYYAATAYEGQGLGPYKGWDMLGNKTFLGSLVSGQENGIERYYYPNGSVMSKALNCNDLKIDECVYYDLSGEEIIKIDYHLDFILNVSTRDAQGKWQKQKISNEEIRIKGYDSNGKIACDFGVKDNLFEGAFLIYSDGILQLEKSYENALLEGELKKYYATGELYCIKTLSKGDYNGAVGYYEKDGTPIVECNYLYDLFHGDFKIYQDGKCEKTKTYKFDELVEVK